MISCLITFFFSFFSPKHWFFLNTQLFFFSIGYVHMRSYCRKLAKLAPFFAIDCENIHLIRWKSAKFTLFHNWFFEVHDFCLNWLHKYTAILMKPFISGRFFEMCNIFFTIAFIKIHNYFAENLANFIWKKKLNNEKMAENSRKLKRKPSSRNRQCAWQHGNFSRLFVCEYHCQLRPYFQCRLIQNNLKSEINIEYTKLRKARINNRKSKS